jgi:sporulation protein YlmC with PRC-barrel domain
MARQAAHDLKPPTLCGLDGQRVHREDGRALGHLFDLHCAWQPGEESSAVDELIYGRTGLLERLGLLHRQPASVPWSSVRRIEDKAIVVSAEAPEGPAKKA